MVTVTVDAGRREDLGEAIQELQGRETEGGAAGGIGRVLAPLTLDPVEQPVHNAQMCRTAPDAPAPNIPRTPGV